MDSKLTIIMAFAKNNLTGVETEAASIYNFVQSNDLVKNVKIENADIDTLAESIIDNVENLFMFHYGGHANQHNIVLDGFRNLDKIRLSRLLIPKENHNLSIVFLNGCLTYGQVGLLTAKGVKVIIATNVNVDDAEAVRLSKFFYKCFFEKNYTLKDAFESAEATVKGKNSYPIPVNPGEIDEKQPMPSSWTLFVHSKHTQVLEWTLEDFVKKKKIKKL
jgi:CHAT domain